MLEHTYLLPPERPVLDSLFHPLKKLLDISLNVASQELSAIALIWFSVWANQQLLKVPSNVIPADWAPNDELGVGHEGHGVITGKRQLFLEIGKQGVGILSIHIHLLKKREFRLKAIAWTDVFKGLKDLIILAILLLK